MPLLDAAFAFALTMLLVATAVTAVLRVVAALSRIRQDQLKALLEEFYESELEPVVRSELIRLRGKAAAAITDEAQEQIEELAGELKKKLLENPKLSQLVRAHAENTAPKTTQDDKEEIRRLVEVGSEELIERLRRTELGERLMTDLGQGAEEVFQKLANRYEAVGEVFSESFRNKSRRWSTIVAMILAFCVNIDSFHLLSTYINDDDVRARVLAQYDAVLEQYRVLVPEADGGGDPAGGKATGEEDVDSVEAGKPPASDTSEGTEAHPELGAVREELERLEKQLDVLQTSGFPVGWELYPYCFASPEDDRRCLFRQGRIKQAKIEQAGAEKAGPGTCPWLICEAAFWVWFVGCLVTGMLAGLGAPFWYDLVAGIAKSAKSYRSQGPAGKAPPTD